MSVVPDRGESGESEIIRVSCTELEFSGVGRDLVSQRRRKCCFCFLWLRIGFSWRNKGVRLASPEGWKDWV